MKGFRRFVLRVLLLISIFCIVPTFLLLIGVYDLNSLFHRPPSAVLTALHCDNEVKDEKGFTAMRLTAVISTHNLEGKDVKIQAKFLYEDGTPVLSKIDLSPLEVSKLVKAYSNDSLLTVNLHTDYYLFPDESIDKIIKCQIYLSYPDWDNNIVEQEQSKSYTFRREVLNDNSSNEKSSASVKNIYVEHNVEIDGTKGMQISIEFDSKNLKDETLYCMVRFYNGDGSPLVQESDNEKYRSINGNVIVGEYTSPDYDDCKTRTTLFIPYKELPTNTGGRTDLILDASILHYTTDTEYEVLDRSKTYSFYITND